jgi:SAM-dependent MidA family methyltransferase
MDAALYDEAGGFYASGGRAGRRGDFVTSPEVGPLFAAVLGRALDRWWNELGRPDPFVVVEAAAGTGTLARDILAAGPACAPALRYVLVERSAALRAVQPAQVPLEVPALVLGPVEPASGDADPDDESVQRVRDLGPLATSLADLPAFPVTGVVLANELLDNLPFDLLEWRAGTWSEVRVGAAAGGELEEVLLPAASGLAEAATRLSDAPTPLPDGARVPLQRGAGEWVRRALDGLERGRLVVVDYADTTPRLARRPWAEWLRTYRRHQRGGSLLEDPGSHDITCEVATDQLAQVRPPDAASSQAEFLARHGIGELAEAARQEWRERAAVGDLAAMKARSRVHEAEALSDPDGLGGFCVLEWSIEHRR